MTGVVLKKAQNTCTYCINKINLRTTTNYTNKDYKNIKCKISFKIYNHTSNDNFNIFRISQVCRVVFFVFLYHLLEQEVLFNYIYIVTIYTSYKKKFAL